MELIMKKQLVFYLLVSVWAGTFATLGSAR